MLTGLAGCRGVTSYRFSAPPVVLPTDTAPTAEYELLLATPVVDRRTRRIGSVDVTATVESYVTVYGATEPAGRATPALPTIGVLSTPRASVMGRSFNPLVRQSLATVPTSEAGTAFLRRARLDEVGHSRVRLRWTQVPTLVATQAGTCLDTRTQLDNYAGVLGGDPPSAAFLHLTRVAAESVVITAAIHGRDVQDPNRPFVAPDAGYLSPATLETATDAFATAAAMVEFTTE